MARIIVVTSGKGGVGKTTSSAAIATGLAQKGKKTVVIDFDIGLRNLDLIMGCERRVVYDFVNVIQGDATLNQALIKDKRTENLYILPASQTRDKDALTREGVDKVLEELKKMEFDFIVCDSPAGIETGALMALYLLMKPSSPPTRKSPPFATPTVSLAFSPPNPVVRKMAKSRSKSTCC
jgi:septum site-determining protein MinD